MLDATIVAKLCSLFCFYFKENWENLKGKKYASPWMMLPIFVYDLIGLMTWNKLICGNGYLEARVDHFWHCKAIFLAPLWIRICPNIDWFFFIKKRTHVCDSYII